MNDNIPYKVGYAHGSRGQPMYKFFSPEGCHEDTQYRQGYIAGNLDRQLDIQRYSNDQRSGC